MLHCYRIFQKYLAESTEKWKSIKSEINLSAYSVDYFLQKFYKLWYVTLHLKNSMQCSTV